MAFKKINILVLLCAAMAFSMIISVVESAELVQIKRLQSEAFAGSYGRQLAYSPDGKLIAVGQHQIGIWNAQTGQKVHEFDGHRKSFWYGGGVSELAFTSDSRKLISCGHDGAIRFWDTQTGKLSREILAPWILADEELNVALGRAPLHSLSISPDDKILALSAHDWTIRLWETGTGKYLGKLGASTAETIDAALLKNASDQDKSDPAAKYWKLPVSSGRSPPDVCFSPNGRLLAAVNLDSVSIWDVDTRKLQSILAGGGRGVFSPNGESFVTGIYDGVTVWNPKTGARIRSFSDPIRIFTPLQFSPDGKILATGSDLATGIRLWDFASGKLIRSLAYGGQGASAIRFSPDGSRLATTVGRHHVHIFDVETGRNLFDAAHTDKVEELAFSTDGRFLISGGNDTSIRLWDAQSWELTNSLIQAKMYVSALLPIGDPQRILVGDSSGVTRLLRIPTLEIDLSLSHQKLKVSNDVSGYALLGDRLFVGIDDVEGAVETWDWNSHKLLSRDPQHPTYHLLMATSRDHSIVATADYNGNVVVWEDSPTNRIAKFKIDGNHTSAIAVSPDGEKLVAVGRKEAQQVLQILQARTGKEVYRTIPGGSDITEAVWSPDGNLLALASMGQPGLFLLDENELRQVDATRGFHSLAFSPNGGLLAAGDDEGQITVWRVTP